MIGVPAPVEHSVDLVQKQEAVLKTTHSDAIILSVPTHDEQMVSQVLNQQRFVEQVGRIGDSQSQEIIETLMQDNSAADTSDGMGPG